MAIQYEAQQPMDERIYSAYGAAQARAADRDFALKAGAQAQQAAHQSSALAQQDEHFIEQQRQQSQLAYAQMGHQENMQDSQQTAAMHLQQNRQNFEFTQADNLRLQRLNQDAAGWESLRQSNEIEPAEYEAGVRMLNQGRMPLQARRDAAEQAHIRKQNDLLTQQSAVQATRADADHRFMTRDGPQQHTDVNGRQWAEIRPQHWEEVKPESTVANDRREAQVADLFTRTYATQIDRISRMQADPLSPADIRSLTPDQIETRALERTQAITSAFRRQLEGGSGASSGQQTETPAVQTNAGQQVPATGQVPEPGVRAAAQSSGTPMGRVRAVAQIANALTPDRGAPSHGGLIDWSNDTERNLAVQLHDIIGTARRAGRTLTNREATDFENARRRLEAVNPDAARLYSLAPTPEQAAYGHSQGRAEKLNSLTPLLRDEAGRIFNSTSMAGRIGEQFGSGLVNAPGVQHVGRMFDLLNTASQENRRLTDAETTRYLRDWRQLRRLNSGWADRLSLHQD